MATPSTLALLLDTLDPDAPQVERHLWLVRLLDWMRGDRSSVATTLERLLLLIERLESDAELRTRAQAWWRALLGGVDGTTLLADHGFAQRPVFLSEFISRLMHRVLPATPQTRDASELHTLLFPHDFDAAWLGRLDEETERRLAAALGLPSSGAWSWHAALEESIACCVSQICAIGYSPELRLRMEHSAHLRAYRELLLDFETLRRALHQRPLDPSALDQAVQAFKDRLDDCRQSANAVYEHLDEHGISVDVVFRLRQLRERILRCRLLLDALLAPDAAGTGKLLAQLVQAGHNSRSLRALIASNSSLLAAKVAERSAETGEHYITRNRADYYAMVRKAAGGGAVMSVTTLIKFALLGLGLSAFWSGFAAGLNYALSFVLIQLLHWTVATKQPAMTAPAMAAKLKSLDAPGAVEDFVDEVTHLVRSQVAAVIGNLALVVPGVLLLCGGLWLFTGHAPLSREKAEHVLGSLTLLGPTALYAAFTGVLLFASSIIAGWTENWFVLQRMDSALRYHPRITAVLGKERAARWSVFARENISGLAANISLGLMLGLAPAFAVFFGLGLDVRHVTLSTGQIAAASMTLGLDVLRLPVFWWCVAAIAVTGALNVAVSFFFAFRLALRAHNVTGLDRVRIYRAIRARARRAPLSFFWPARETAAPAPVPHG
ncbi:MAG: site-specific recombinase [Burkholderiaceae bacterium]|nr:site-specific recombinase [Burkholderiaceae bacterium]